MSKPMDRNLYEIAEKNIKNRIISYDFQERPKKELFALMRPFSEWICNYGRVEMLPPAQFALLLEPFLEALKKSG
jgi:hypothetical protein